MHCIALLEFYSCWPFLRYCQRHNRVTTSSGRLVPFPHWQGTSAMPSRRHWPTKDLSRVKRKPKTTCGFGSQRHLPLVSNGTRRPAGWPFCGVGRSVPGCLDPSGQLAYRIRRRSIEWLDSIIRQQLFRTIGRFVHQSLSSQDPTNPEFPHLQVPVPQCWDKVMWCHVQTVGSQPQLCKLVRSCSNVKWIR